MHTRYNINDCVEIFGLGEWDDYNESLKLIANLLNLNYNDILYSVKKGNSLLVKLINNRAVNEWERKSKEKRINLSNIKSDVVKDNKIKIFAAAPTKFKLLLHNVRKILPHFKYIWIGKKGVMAREKSRSQIYLIKNDEDVSNLQSFINNNKNN